MRWCARPTCAAKFGELREIPCLRAARLVGWSFSSDMECQHGSGLQSWWENNCSGPECVAPTALRIMVPAVPSPSGLGTRQGKISTAVGAADASAGKSYDLQRFSDSHPDS